MHFQQTVTVVIMKRQELSFLYVFVCVIVLHDMSQYYITFRSTTVDDLRNQKQFNGKGVEEIRSCDIDGKKEHA